MRLLWLSVMGLAFLGLPIAASDESSQCGDEQFVIKEVVTCNITSTEEGTYTLATTFKTEYGPMDMEMVYTKQEDGMYKNDLGDKVTETRKMDGQTYAITNVRDLENNGKSCKILSLYSKETSVSDSVKQAFIDLAMEKQINREQIFLFASKDAATKSA